ncbi:YjbF family lipoprotein [Gammaproteobacteria bacterium]|nr:YjbF family lipoprotein [Gammaproteobacteria bacterium]
MINKTAYIIVLLILLTACSSIDLGYFQDARNAFKRNEIIVTDTFKENLVYSFIKVSNKKNDAIFVLSNISEDGVYEWIGSNFESIKTKEGLIVNTKGLESDIKFFSTNFSLFNSTVVQTQVNLSNPDLTYTDITLELKKSMAKDSHLNAASKIITLEYRRIFPNIGMSSKDIYIYKNGRIFSSKQRINPLKEPIEIFFYFQ